MLFFFSTRAWTQGLHLELLHQSFFFCEGFFKIGSRELFAQQAGFELRSSWSLPPESVTRITNRSHWYFANRCLLIAAFSPCSFYEIIDRFLFVPSVFWSLFLFPAFFSVNQIYFNIQFLFF
jgi:hypothetical protein